MIKQGEYCTKETDIQEDFKNDAVILQFVGNDYINFSEVREEINIFDIMGRLILTFNDTKVISLSILNDGLYFVKIGNNVYKFLKK